MNELGKTIPEYFGYDVDKFVKKYDDLSSALMNAEDDIDMIKLADLISDDKLESLALMWCISKTSIESIQHYSYTHFKKTLEVMFEAIHHIEDDLAREIMLSCAYDLDNEFELKRFKEEDE
jgi:hypothetical protein